MNYSKANLAYYFLLATIWSGSFIGIKAVITFWPPLFGAAIRVGIALVCLLLIVLVRRKKAIIPFSSRVKIWMIGLFSQAIPFSLLFYGEQIISPGLAGILNSTASIWTFLLSLLFLSQTTKFSLLKLIGLVIGLCGIVIIFWPLVSFDKNIATLIGAMAVLGMAFSYAVGGLLNQVFFKGSSIDFFTNVYHQHCASFIFLIIVSLVFGSWPSITLLLSDVTPWLASLYLGIFSTAIAYVMFYHLIRVWDAIHASTVLYFVPMLAIVWDYLIYHNRPNAAELVGVLIILIGIVFIQLPTLLATFKRKHEDRQSGNNSGK